MDMNNIKLDIGLFSEELFCIDEERYIFKYS